MVLTQKDIDDSILIASENIERQILLKLNDIKNDIIDEVAKLLQNNIESITARLTDVETQAANTLELAQRNETLLLSLQSLVKETNEKKIHPEIDGSDPHEIETILIDDLKKQKSMTNNLENRIEERTNRQLRKTLIIKGIPEKNNESWKDTTNLLAKTISKASNFQLMMLTI